MPLSVRPKDFDGVVPDLHASACKGLDAWLVGFPRLWLSVVRYFEEDILTDVCDVECASTTTTLEPDSDATTDESPTTGEVSTTTDEGGGGGTTTATAPTTPEGEPCGTVCVTITNNSGYIVAPSFGPCPDSIVEFSGAGCSSQDTFYDIPDGGSTVVCASDPNCNGDNIASVQLTWSFDDGAGCQDCGGGFATRITDCEWEIEIGPPEDYGCPPF